VYALVTTFRVGVSAVLLLSLAGLSLGGCKGRVDRAQCDQLVGRFAELVVKEKMPGAAPGTVLTEQARERAEAANDDSFRNCPTELRIEDYRCAMAATTAEAFLKCLE
jgi:hypothetical protein